MKIVNKLFLFCVCSILLTFPFFSGCAVSDRYKDLYSEFDAFVQDANYTQFFNSDIDFSSAIQSEKTNTSSEYYVINYYEGIVGVALANITRFYSTFEIMPVYNTDSTKKLCNEAINKLSSFKEEVQTFNIQKSELETTVATVGLEQSLMTFRDFKVHLGELAVSANNLQLAFMNAYGTLYCQNIIRDESGSASDVKSSIARIQSSLINDYVNFAIVEYKNIHPQPEQPFPMYSSILELNDALNTTNTASNYASWLEIYNLFVNEEQMFLTSLATIDYSDTETTRTGELKQYELKITNFVNNNASLFVNRTLTAFY